MTCYTFCQNLNSIRAGTCLFMSCSLCPEQCLAHSRCLVITYYMNDFYCHSTTLTRLQNNLLHSPERKKIKVIDCMGFPGGPDGKEPACNAGDPGFDPWLGKIPWRREWLPLPVFLLGEFHGQRSLAGYSLWYHRVGHYCGTTTFQTKRKCMA